MEPSVQDCVINFRHTGGQDIGEGGRWAKNGHRPWRLAVNIQNLPLSGRRSFGLHNPGKRYFSNQKGSRMPSWE
jgi:hypothetical protein